MKNKSEILNRIKNSGLSYLKLSNETGIDNSTIGKWFKQGSNPDIGLLLIIDQYLDSIQSGNNQGDANNTSNNVINEPGESYITKRRLLKHSQQPNAMPVYEAAPATLTNIESYRDEIQKEPDFWLSIPQYRNCNYSCRAKGDSMHPVIKNHALVGGVQVIDFKVIIFGDIYIIHLKNGIETIKYIHPDETKSDSILLVPYNGNAKVTPVMKEDILRIYAAEFVINPL